MANKSISFNNLHSNLEFELSSLGLDEMMLRNVVWMGLQDIKAKSDLEPLNAAGSRASFTMTRVLRVHLLKPELGWSMLNQNGLAMTVNKERGLSIVLASGDKFTGLRELIAPSTKNSRGKATSNLVEHNHKVIRDLFCETDENLVETDEPKQQEQVDKHQLWVLLYHFDYAKKEVRYELSLPDGMRPVGEDGKIKISKWKQRFIFNSLPFDDNTFDIPPQEFTEDIEFDELNVKKAT
ncbi:MULTISPECIES: hypothetical protein [Shewanella]|uniref:hypothetical protein n=1 Tax=Shewanella TaxID=22 RepID=UPI00313B63C5